MALRIAFLFLLMFGGYQSVFAQSYGLAVGLRTGSQSGVTLRQINENGLGLEGMLVYYQHGVQVVGLLEYQMSLGNKTGASLLIGIGGHAGYREWFNSDSRAVPTAGADVLLGFEYEINHAVAIGLDLKPQLELLNSIRISGNQAGASLRFFLE